MENKIQMQESYQPTVLVQSEQSDYSPAYSAPPTETLASVSAMPQIQFTLSTAKVCSKPSNRFYPDQQTISSREQMADAVRLRFSFS